MEKKHFLTRRALLAACCKARKNSCKDAHMGDLFTIRILNKRSGGKLQPMLAVKQTAQGLCQQRAINPARLYGDHEETRRKNSPVLANKHHDPSWYRDILRCSPSAIVPLSPCQSCSGAGISAAKCQLRSPTPLIYLME